MSAKHVGLALSLQPSRFKMTAPQKDVLIQLCDKADPDDDTCFPSKAYIATLCGISKHTVDRCIPVLIGKGFVSVESQLRENGSQSSHLYTVHLSALIEASEWQRAQIEAERRAKKTGKKGKQAVVVSGDECGGNPVDNIGPEDIGWVHGGGRGGCMVGVGVGAQCTPHNQEPITKKYLTLPGAREAEVSPRPVVDDAIRSTVVRDKRYGENFAKSYLDTASVGEDGTIFARTRTAFDRLRQCEALDPALIRPPP